MSIRCARDSGRTRGNRSRVLWFAGRRGDLLEELVASCSKRDDVECLANQAMNAFGRIDVWVNNAGIGVPSKMHATIEKGAPAGDSPGAVLEPIPEGTEVSGGNRGKRSRPDDREEQRG